MLSSSFAGGMSNMNLMTDETIQRGVSFVYTDPTHSFGLGLDLQSEKFELGVNTGYSRTKTAAGITYSEWFLSAYAGARKEIASLIYGAIGLMGDYDFLYGDYSGAGLTTEPYSYGPYLGLEYQPTPQFQLYVRAMPYSYHVSNTNVKTNEIFERGQVGFKYFFA